MLNRIIDFFNIRIILLKLGLIAVHNPYKIFSLHEKNNFVWTSYAKLIKGMKKRAKQFNATNSERSIDISTIGDHEIIIRLYGKGQDASYRIVLDYLYDGQAIKVFNTQDKDYYQAAYYAKANDGKLRLTDGVNNFADVKSLTDRIWKDLSEAMY